MSSGALSAASRRSGPCDLAKLRTCTVRSGTHWPRLTGSVAATAPAESSSMTAADVYRTTSASSAARSAVSETPVGFCARGCR